MFGWNPCDGMFYYPSSKVYEHPEDHGLRYESVTFKSTDGVSLHGYFLPARGTAEGTVLHLHGNAGNVTGHFPLVRWLPAWGWNLLCFDYRGFGRSEGRISRAGSIADAHAAVDYLLSRGDVDQSRLVAYGQSIGGAIATVVGAERTELRAFFLEAPFSGYRRMAGWHIRRNPLLLAIGWWVPWLLMSRGNDAVDFIGKLAPRPVLIMHGESDTTVPCTMARELFDAAREPKGLWVEPGMDHLEPMENLGTAVCQRVVDFFLRGLAENPGAQ